MMTVTKIEPLSKTRYKVYLDGQFAFTLYKGELSRYHIAEESVIEDDIYDSLRLIVIKRAKLRAMHLLSDMGRTESQLRTKLKQGGLSLIHIYGSRRQQSQGQRCDHFIELWFRKMSEIYRKRTKEDITGRSQRRDGKRGEGTSEKYIHLRGHHRR